MPETPLCKPPSRADKHLPLQSPSLASRVSPIAPHERVPDDPPDTGTAPQHPNKHAFVFTNATLDTEGSL
ncbi:hypothetical protein EJ04DRAFT_510206 [Polyplosphaeria fusca]|uniref:Uncharacterized protein n=1 Tax=Polyplosphaeria fusca TaxID=682080 RepID=A0A9P4R5V7_9PLEO|nr:hypothetical protein EJ04DRAFT_510206 [Polyplosphaeria fusca]